MKAFAFEIVSGRGAGGRGGRSRSYHKRQR
jgi:hypothetical protein